MENNSELENQNILPKLHLSSEQKLNCYKQIYTSLLKLLDLIESELGEGKQRYKNKEVENCKIDISSWFENFIYTIHESDKLCDYKLTKVLMKIYGLYDKTDKGEYKYKTMTHQEYKNQIMESREIVKHLMDEQQKKIEEEKISK